MASRVTDDQGRFITKHGMSFTNEYGIWGNMLYRCNNPSASQYAKYGGRGISVCRQWLDFENFIRDMGNRPSPLHSIDRIDVNGDYCPENCRWATPKVQGRNRRNTRIFTYNEECMSLMDIIEKYNLPKQRTISRIKRGWAIELAVELPEQPKFGGGF